MAKRILFFIHSLGMGGAEKVLLAYVKGLMSIGNYHITIATNEDSSEYVLAQEAAKFATIVNLDSKKECSFAKKIFSSFGRRQAINRLVDDSDVVIDFLDGDFFKCMNRHKKPKIMWLHSSFYNLEGRKRHMRKRCENYDRIILICQDMLAELKHEQAGWLEKVRVLYNPFDYSHISSQAEKYEGCSSLEKKLLQEEYVLSVSRLDEQTKDIEGLIQAYANALDKGLNKKLVIIGDGPDRDYLESVAANLKLHDRVHFIGLKANPYVWMKHADTFVLSSRGEGFGLVLVEALLLCGRVISTDCPVGPSEVLERGRLGTLVPMGDVPALTDALLNPPPKLSNIDLAKYSSESVLREFDNMLRELL
ncbi:glycosyltransferase [Aeromonas veronii]|uniref:glycosyltransferase n=1 Tax=Aeromonas veronii TaxID=654 RepID=UPI00214D4288|nr:glycosyltransferase [Aeromonas veronii]MCR3966353.1 glycosyltransferase [Aeromonas veronii]MCR3978829.1 glycosyltransferase [Aeromonas veronii]